MIARIQKSLEKKEQGFTLIELLVVIIIIGILAAIAIPAFLNQREKAWSSQVESDLKNAAIAAESYAVGNNGSYVGLNDAALIADGFHSTANVTVAISGVSVSDYTLTGTHANMAADSWVYTAASGKITHTP